MSYHDDDEEYMQVQLETIAKFEREREEQERRHQDLESQAIANAIAVSEQQYIDTANRLDRESESLANRMHQEEADEVYVAALNTSATEHEAEQISRRMETDVLKQKRQRTEERNQGCWDCGACTYTNLPYTKTCAVCGESAPATVLTFCPLAPMRFGVEIEIIVPDGVRDGYTMESIATELTRIGPPKVHYAGYTHETTEFWKIVRDSSVGGNNENDLCFELVSPVLQGDDGLASLRAMLENVRRIGIATNSTCGFHVHVDATKATNPQQRVTSMGTLLGIKRVAQYFVAFENAFDLLVARSWEQNHHSSNRRSDVNRYCKSNRLVFGSLSNRQRWDQIESARNFTSLIHMINPDDDRYFKLNLTNIIHPRRPSTCEFRHHGGVEELPQAEAWVRLVIRFCEQASTGDRIILQERSTPKDELDAFFRLIGCDGLAQFFVAEKRLFGGSNNSGLSNDWQCKVCRRSFKTSRDLAQHLNMTRHR